MRAILEVSPLTAAFAATKDTMRSAQQEKLLRDLNSKKKSFEFLWEHVRMIEAKKPG